MGGSRSGDGRGEWPDGDEEDEDEEEEEEDLEACLAACSPAASSTSMLSRGTVPDSVPSAMAGFFRGPASELAAAGLFMPAPAPLPWVLPFRFSPLPSAFAWGEARWRMIMHEPQI